MLIITSYFLAAAISAVSGLQYVYEALFPIFMAQYSWRYQISIIRLHQWVSSYLCQTFGEFAIITFRGVADLWSVG
jgi:hypothetical protein